MALADAFSGNETLTKNDNGTLRVGNRIPSDSFPRGEIIGDEFYDTVTKILWVYNGTQWDPISGSGMTVYSKATGTISNFQTVTTFSDLNLGGFLDFNFTKRAAHTSLLVWGHVTYFSLSAAGLTINGVRINGVDYQLGHFFFNELAVHNTMGLHNKIAAGLAPGTYSARPRWRLNAAGAQVVQINGDDVYHLNIMEVF